MLKLALVIQLNFFIQIRIQFCVSMSCVKCFVIVHKCSNKINAFNVNKQYFDRGVLFLFLFWFRFSVVRFFFRNLTLDYQIGALVVFFFIIVVITSKFTLTSIQKKCFYRTVRIFCVKYVINTHNSFYQKTNSISSTTKFNVYSVITLVVYIFFFLIVLRASYSFYFIFFLLFFRSHADTRSMCVLYYQNGWNFCYARHYWQNAVVLFFYWKFFFVDIRIRCRSCTHNVWIDEQQKERKKMVFFFSSLSFSFFL